MAARKFVSGLLGWGDFSAAAAELNISIDTLRRDIRRARQHQNYDAWRPRQRGRKKGTSKFAPLVHQVIEREVYRAARHPQNFSLTAREIEGALIAEGLPIEEQPKPSSARRLAKAVEAKNFPHFQRARYGRHGDRNVALQRGEITASRPLEIVMIDHTIFDAHVWFDIGSRRVALRPTVTAAKDLCTGVTLAAFLSPLRPSSSTVALAMALMSVPKTKLLQQYDLPGTWEPHGTPLQLLADGEFESEGLRAALAKRGGELVIGPPGDPDKRPHIERVFGVWKEQIHRLQGATLSNPQHLEAHGGRRPTEMTFEQAQRQMLNIVTAHNNETYEGMKPPPLALWEAAIGQPGVMAQVPISPFETFIHFLPRRFPKIGFEGLKCLGGLYRSTEVAVLKLEGVKEVEVAFDPRDISQVWLLRDGQPPAPVPRVVHTTAPTDFYGYKEWRKGERASARGLRDSALLSQLKVARDTNHLWTPSPAIADVTPPRGPTRLRARHAADDRRFADFKPAPMAAQAPQDRDVRVEGPLEEQPDDALIIPTYQWWSR
ncbi:Mu transposase C-terminal domain-containing protein [Caulobacter segnis]|uniref:Mu transposase C-terminal domain-containing protein n=1 Tax=Caulobacter segnis TaxID=88688 RepID=UPI00241029F0|nr:Mu transposase C-terminal domain-containing protein [Caulobacter segnis]MDG2522148.1 Mu transposase C-terminal domain-containing protein [Caulobacter segnis]